jgi:hypothetical protein
MKMRVIDALASPAMYLLQPFFHEGPHTGQGVPFWGYYALLANCLVYLVFWFAAIALWGCVIGRGRQKKRRETLRENGARSVK